MTNKPSRLKDWDYSGSGCYFVTICTANKWRCFGEVIKGEVYLSSIGEIAKVCMIEIPSHLPTVDIDSFVVMPDHIHGIVVINQVKGRALPWQGPHRTSINSCGGAAMAAPCHQSIAETNIQPRGKPISLSSIIGLYKSSVTRLCHKKGYKFTWQTNFYDHIIKSDQELERTRQYIKENPINYEGEMKGKNNFDNSIYVENISPSVLSLKII